MYGNLQGISFKKTFVNASQTFISRKAFLWMFDVNAISKIRSCSTIDIFHKELIDIRVLSTLTGHGSKYKASVDYFLIIVLSHYYHSYHWCFHYIIIFAIIFATLSFAVTSLVWLLLTYFSVFFNTTPFKAASLARSMEGNDSSRKPWINCFEISKWMKLAL